MAENLGAAERMEVESFAARMDLMAGYLEGVDPSAAAYIAAALPGADAAEVAEVVAALNMGGGADLMFTAGLAAGAQPSAYTRIREVLELGSGGAQGALSLYLVQVVERLSAHAEEVAREADRLDAIASYRELVEAGLPVTYRSYLDATYLAVGDLELDPDPTSSTAANAAQSDTADVERPDVRHFEDPDNPVSTTSLFLGISTLIFFRLC